MEEENIPKIPVPAHYPISCGSKELCTLIQNYISDLNMLSWEYSMRKGIRATKLENVNVDHIINNSQVLFKYVEEAGVPQKYKHILAFQLGWEHSTHTHKLFNTYVAIINSNLLEKIKLKHISHVTECLVKRLHLFNYDEQGLSSFYESLPLYLKHYGLIKPPVPEPRRNRCIIV